MERIDIVENYQNAIENIYHHIGYWNDWEFCVPEFTHLEDRWKWDGEKVSFYADGIEEDEEITEEDFTGSIETGVLYRGHEYTGIVIKRVYDDDDDFFLFEDVRLEIIKNDMEIKNPDADYYYF